MPPRDPVFSPASDSGSELQARLRQALSDALPPGELAPLEARVQALRNAMAHTTVPLSPVRRHITLWPAPAWRRYAMGAVLLGLVVIMIPVIRTTFSQFQREAPVAERYATQRAQRATFDLPDGSRVVLGPATTLRYTRTGAVRTIDLEGEAYFTVTPDSRTSFSVRARNVTTHVLGTSFSVRAYETDVGAQIAVAEGKVETRIGSATSILVAGDVASVTSPDSIMVTRDVRISEAFGWTRGEVMFKNVPFAQIVPDLERMYDVDVRITDPELANRTITVLLTGDRVGDVLQMIAQALDVTYDWNGTHVVFKQRRLHDSQHESRSRNQ